MQSTMFRGRFLMNGRDHRLGDVRSFGDSRHEKQDHGKVGKYKVKKDAAEHNTQFLVKRLDCEGSFISSKCIFLFTLSYFCSTSKLNIATKGDCRETEISFADFFSEQSRAKSKGKRGHTNFKKFSK